METKVVFITGATTGIGLSTAIKLMNQGVRVYGASRRGGISQKAEHGKGEIIQLPLDVNNEDDIKIAISKIVSENSRLDALICNAGNGIAGSIEDTSSEEVKYQFETNFFGAIKTIQACLPIFRAQGYGKIITTSSVAGIIPIPYQAFYSAVKAALLVFMQALSMEVKSFGIQCCTILPGDTKTGFTAARVYTKQSASSDSVYIDKMTKSVKKMEIDEQNGMSPESIASAIVRQINKNTMNAMVVPGFQYKFFCFLFKILPLKLKLWIIGKVY